MSDLDFRPTLVMGARGNVGRHVLNGLVSRGVRVRASARKPMPGWFPADVEVHAADLTDPVSLTHAFRGVARVFLYANQEGVAGVIEAAQTAGVEKIVLLSSGSVIHPPLAGNPITESHREVERAFAKTELTVVPIRPLVLATNALGWSYPIKAGRPLPLYKPTATTAPIHEKDIAAVAVASLLGEVSPTFSGMLTGPRLMSQREQAAAIGAGIGASIEVVELTWEDALARLARFMPAQEAKAVLQFIDEADAGNSPTTRTVEEILGRPAIGFDQWAVDHAADFR